MISKLSNQELDASLKRLVGSERKILHSILEHINEVQSRRLYLERAYSSLYEYLVKECNYSGAAAMRRISAAKLLKEVPLVSEKIQSGALNLSQIGELSRAVKEKEQTGGVVSLLEKKELIAAISGKTTAETQKAISYGLDLELKIPEKKFVQKDDSVRFEMTFSQEQFQKLLKCKDLASHALLAENVGMTMSDVIEHLADQYLRAKIPKPQVSGTESAKSTVCANSRSNKSVTPKVRGEILQRDQCCQYQDPKSGKICGSTFGLDVDHKIPRWANGSHVLSNLQVLCRSHNNYKYQKESNLRLL